MAYHPERVPRQLSHQQITLRRLFLMPRYQRADGVIAFSFTPFIDDIWENWENYFIGDELTWVLVLPREPSCLAIHGLVHGTISD